MHEMSLAEGVVSILQAEAAAQSFSKVTKVVLEIGALSHVDPHALEFAFDAVTAGTLAEGAALEIRQPPGLARCFACEADVSIARRGDPCPACGSHKLMVTAGDAMDVKELEVV